MNFGFRKNTNSRSGGNIPADMGNAVCAMDLFRIARENPYNVAALWTGKGLQSGVMSIPAGQMHEHKREMSDAIIIFVSGMGELRTGALGCTGERRVTMGEGNTFFIPAGEPYDVVNTGNSPLQIVFVHAPASMPHGTRY
jgi:mannose-6-phosphate isomerase-like protein (cupin superfamily)